MLLLKKYSGADSCLVESDGTDRPVDDTDKKKPKSQFDKRKSDDEAEGVLGTSRGASVRPRSNVINLIDSPQRTNGAPPRVSLNLGTANDPICID